MNKTTESRAWAMACLNGNLSTESSKNSEYLEKLLTLNLEQLGIIIKTMEKFVRQNKLHARRAAK
jgi:hypothetical protein